MPKGVYTRTPSHLKMLRVQMRKIQPLATRYGDKNHIWHGDNVSYRALHFWVRRNKPIPTHCSICDQEKKLQASNISGKYKRELSDWEYICARCHIYKDGTINNLKPYGKKNRKN